MEETLQRRGNMQNVLFFPSRKMKFLVQVAVYPIISSSAWIILKSLILSFFSLLARRHISVCTHARICVCTHTQQYDLCSSFQDV